MAAEALPVTALRSYMRAAGWTEGVHGTAGSLWTKGPYRFAVPHEDDDQLFTRGAIERLAQAEHRTPDETTAAVLAHRDVAVSLDDGECDRLRALMADRDAEIDSPVAATDDTGRDLPGGPERSRDRAGAGPREPVVMPQDEFGLVKWLQDALAEAIGPAWGLAAVGCALEAVTPVVEHAARAAAGSHEGIRLWMLDCGSLVQKHREHAAEASIRLGEQRERAEAAEAKLAEVRSVLLEGGQGDATARRRAIAIVGTGEGVRSE